MLELELSERMERALLRRGAAGLTIETVQSVIREAVRFHSVGVYPGSTVQIAIDNYGLSDANAAVVRDTLLFVALAHLAGEVAIRALPPPCAPEPPLWKGWLARLWFPVQVVLWRLEGAWLKRQRGADTKHPKHKPIPQPGGWLLCSRCGDRVGDDRGDDVRGMTRLWLRSPCSGRTAREG